MEAAPFDLSHSTQHDATSKHGDGAKTQSAQEEGPSSLIKAYGKGTAIEQQHEGSDESFPLKSRGGGIDGGAKGNAGGEKKRKKRAKNWTDEETEILLEAVPQKTKFKSRFDKCSGSAPRWEGIAEGVPGRTGDECRMRMDTLTKSYNTIKEYCDERKKEFRQLKQEDLGAMKLATPFTESWYNRIRDSCPPRSNKKRTKQGAGSPLANGVNFVSCASTLGEGGSVGVESHNPNAESPKVVMTTPDRVSQSKLALEAFEVGVSEAKLWKLMLVIVLVLECDVKNWVFLVAAVPHTPNARDVEDGLQTWEDRGPRSAGHLLSDWDGVPALGERHQDPSHWDQYSDSLMEITPCWINAADIDTSDVPWPHVDHLPVTGFDIGFDAGDEF